MKRETKEKGFILETVGGGGESKRGLDSRNEERKEEESADVTCHSLCLISKHRDLWRRGITKSHIRRSPRMGRHAPFVALQLLDGVLERRLEDVI